MYHSRLLLLLLLVSTFSITFGKTYSVTATRINRNLPVFSSQNRDSPYKYNYNTAVVPLKDSFALLVRSQNTSDPSNPYSVLPSVLGFTKLKGNFNPDDIQFTDFHVVFEPSQPDENYGTEDPRIVYREKDNTYYLLYTAAQEYETGKITARLAEATTQTPDIKESWKRYGPIFPEESWSKSGAMLIRDGFQGPHYLIYGDSTIVRGLEWATSDDLINWKRQSSIFLPVRPTSFDSILVEAGPMPLPLSDGNYLFLYNSARCCVPSQKPGWNQQYNVGWVVLDREDPTKILQRSSVPLLSPELPWERGVEPYLGNTPNVVFLEGWIPYPNLNDTFIAFYGAADSVIGAAIVKVSFE